MFIQIEDYWNTLKSKRINTENIAWYEPIDSSKSTFTYTIKIRFRARIEDSYDDKYIASLKYKSKAKRNKVIKFLDETVNLKTQTDSITL